MKSLGGSQQLCVGSRPFPTIFLTDANMYKWYWYDASWVHVRTTIVHLSCQFVMRKVARFIFWIFCLFCFLYVYFLDFLGTDYLDILFSQPTPKDKRANLVIHGLVDKVALFLLSPLKMQRWVTFLMLEKILFNNCSHDLS